ncbi:MAG: hypothetical protein U0165_17395 [Polyangiaceae bacterium]
MLVAGPKVKGTVVQIEKYGAFIQIAGTQGRRGRGLLPMAETVAPRKPGSQDLYGRSGDQRRKILSIDEEAGKIPLVGEGAQRRRRAGEFETFAKAERAKSTDKGTRGFGTLGDLLSKVTIAKK